MVKKPIADVLSGRDYSNLKSVISDLNFAVEENYEAETVLSYLTDACIWKNKLGKVI